MNSDLKEAHKSWSTFALGSQDSSGAVSHDRVDLETSQASVDFAVEFSLHRKADDEILDEIPQPKLTVHSRTCIELVGCCKQCKFHGTAQCLTRAFAHLTTANHLSTGTLVGLKPASAGARSSADRCPGESYFFIGVLCKKPLMQVLARAWKCPGDPIDPSTQTFSMLDMRADRFDPEFCTSHQVFLDMAEGCNGDLSSIEVAVFHSKFECGLWGMQTLQVTTYGAPAKHILKAEVSPPSTKVQTTLPFGLKASPKKNRGLPARAMQNLRRKFRQVEKSKLDCQTAQAVRFRTVQCPLVTRGRRLT
jgi:hypothetical protein